MRTDGGIGEGVSGTQKSPHHMLIIIIINSIYFEFIYSRFLLWRIV